MLFENTDDAVGEPAYPDPPTDRIEVLEEELGRVPADDDHRGSPVELLLGEGAALLDHPVLDREHLR